VIRWWIAEGLVLLVWVAIPIGGGLLAAFLIGSPIVWAAAYGLAVAGLLYELTAFPANRLLDYCQRRASQ